MSPDDRTTQEFAAVDRREDATTRDRVASIFGRIEGATQRMWRAILGLYLCMLIVGVGAYLLFAEIQQSRRDAFTEACRVQNQQNQAIISVLSGSKEQLRQRERRGEVNGTDYDRRLAVLDKYIASFPIVRDCAIYAERKAEVD